MQGQLQKIQKLIDELKGLNIFQEVQWFNVGEFESISVVPYREIKLKPFSYRTNDLDWLADELEFYLSEAKSAEKRQKFNDTITFIFKGIAFGWSYFTLFVCVVTFLFLTLSAHQAGILPEIIEALKELFL